jgi:hypothetical protein
VTRAFRFYALLVLVMGGHLVAIAVDGSSWPYSTFAMFSYGAPKGRTLQRFVPVGVARGGADHSLEPCLRPLTALQIHQGIEAALRESGVRALLRETLDRCARTDPSLAGVRIDEITWQLDADLAGAAARRSEVASYR